MHAASMNACSDRDAFSSPDREEHISLCETLDRVLNKGVVVMGEVVISVADIDLIYLGLNLVLTSVETAGRIGALSTRGQPMDLHGDVHSLK